MRRPRLRDTDRAILGLAIPALGTIAIDPLLTMIDTAFVARVGTSALAALGVYRDGSTAIPSPSRMRPAISSAVVTSNATSRCNPAAANA